MRRHGSPKGAFVSCVGIILALVFSSAMAPAQTVTGQATGIHATVLSLLSPVVTVLSDTGPLAGPDDAREASLPEGGVISLLTASTLHGAAISWADRSFSESSVADLLVSLPGQIIGADFIRTTAQADPADGATAGAEISALSINGVPIAVTGAPNQVIPLPGGRIVINEQTVDSQGIRVVGLRITMDGVADVIVSASKAGF